MLFFQLFEDPLPLSLAQVMRFLTLKYLHNILKIELDDFQSVQA